ncbi:MAG: DUF2075 domain-containing protein [Candidatus Hydrogenedentales bacterium]|jgi:hypothetical protein
MSTAFESTITEFLKTHRDQIVGQLAHAVADIGIESQHSRQIKVWGSEIDLLKEHFEALTLKNSEVANWHILLEYDLPRRQKRPDVVILAHDVILVLEFKVGTSSFDAAARWQVMDYAMNLRDFHAESANRLIVPVLCATEAQDSDLRESISFSKDIATIQETNAHNLGDCLLRVFLAARRYDREAINPEAWTRSAYRPTPTIIEAAERLYENHDVREITHSYAENLDKTTDRIAEVILEAKTMQKYTIVFITGVPGAGKTLTGLNVVHDATIRSKQGPSGIFLSGNGPLIKIIREALVRNQQRQGRKRQDCEHEVSTFIQNVHNFLRHHRENLDAVPHEHVVVFDEAQRAWDLGQMKRKWGVETSEPAQLLEVMERLPGWSVVIALVGGGQEIFKGEAGLGEWGRALLSSEKRWSIVVSPEVLHGGASVAGHSLYEEGKPEDLEIIEEPLAHLKVSVRSHRAQLIAEWVNALLLLDDEEAKAKLPDLDEFPIVVTRDLDAARQWLWAHSQFDLNARCGFVATSGDTRMRAYGLELSTDFLGGYPFEKWFLFGSEDIRSSFRLEVAATEFQCQGLELDWVGVCWGGDLVPSMNDKEWEYQKFRGTKWQNCRSAIDQNYIRNRYRVLLTRARLGMIIWVPRGDSSDKTRVPHRFDRIHAHLRASGVPDLELSSITNRDSHHYRFRG